MGRRSEQRIVASIPVLVRGKDSQGRPFAVAAETHEISYSGASLKGLADLVEPRQKIEIECERQKAFFSVAWVGKAGDPSARRVGVRALEPGKYIWPTPPKGWEKDTFDETRPAATWASYAAAVEGTAGGSAAASSPAPASAVATLATPASWTGANRRRFPRRSCVLEAHVALEGDTLWLPAKVRDISLGGCYVEMLAPLPLESAVEISMDTGGELIQVSGKVVFMQGGLGMGVEFTGMAPVDFEKLRAFVPPVVEQPLGVLPPHVSRVPGAAGEAPFAASNSSGPGTAEALEAVVRVLSRKGLLTSAEVAEELEKVRTVKT